MPEKSLYSRVMARKPKHLADVGDAVTWTAEDPKSGATSGNWEYTACYAPIMNNLGRWKIICRPHPKAKAPGSRRFNRLSKAEYLAVMGRFKEVGLIPDQVECFVTRRGNEMVIPAKDWDRHTVYIALCLYRYVDSKPATMWAALQIWKKTKLPWLQVFQYVMARKGIGAGHGFTGFTTQTSYGGGGGLNPATGMSLCRFGSKTLSQRRKEIPRKTAGFTHGFLQGIQTKLNPTKKKKVKWATVDAPAREFRNLEQILDPHFSPLFTDPEIDDKGLVDLLEGAPEKENI